MTVKAKGLDHVAVAVKDLDKAIALYRDALGLELAEVEEVAEQKVRAAIFGHGMGRVELICPTDPTSGVAAHVSRGGTAGLVRGRGSDGLSFEPLHADAPVGLGDLILTQGYAGGVFPNGLPIGLVEEVGPPRAGLVRTVTVRPFADASALDQVAVVVSSPAPPPAPAGGVRTDFGSR